MSEDHLKFFISIPWCKQHWIEGLKVRANAIEVYTEGLIKTKHWHAGNIKVGTPLVSTLIYKDPYYYKTPAHHQISD